VNQNERARTRQQDATTTSPGRQIWLSRALALLGTLLLATWAIFGDHYPWWASALTLAGSVIAILEALHLARKAGAA
jgi:hypothetical protein